MEKIIICLANSVKNGERCIAGIDIETEEWIRPVNPGGKAIKTNQIQYTEGGQVQVLDMVSIPVIGPEPLPYQPENYIIKKRQLWQKLIVYRESLKGFLCENNNICSTCILYNDSTDRIHKRFFDDLNREIHSLSIIKPGSVLFEKRDKSYWNARPQIRTSFKFNNNSYDLVITDDSFKNQLYNKKYECGYYKVDNEEVHFTISLGSMNERDNCHYKLVAAVIIKGQYNLTLVST